MPWQETCAVDERMRFMEAWLHEQDVAGVARRFGISRKTAYKWIDRFREAGRSGLQDRSRRPHGSPHATDPAVVSALVAIRRAHPTWGPKKLLAKLAQLDDGLDLPATSTAGDIIKRAGLVQTPRRRQRRPEIGRAWPRSDAPNAIWCVDYKGEFRLGNGAYCYPLTLSDEYSRFLLACRGFPRIAGADAQACCEHAFRCCGLPQAIRSDNGSPFASTGLCRLSRLAVWWLRLGIQLRRNVPGHPEHNGRHERIHRDMKAQTTRPPADDLAGQQRRFDDFVQEHNHERPHEALGQQCPAQHYRPSPRPYPERLPQPEYPSHYEVRRVGSNGCIALWGNVCYLSDALALQDVGLVEEDEDRWAVYFASLRLGILDRRSGRIASPPADLDRHTSTPKVTG